MAIVGIMIISVLLRLVPASRTGGRLAGQAVVVETGQTFVFAGDTEVIALLDRLATGSAGSEDAADGSPGIATGDPMSRDQSR